MYICACIHIYIYAHTYTYIHVYIDLFTFIKKSFLQRKAGSRREREIETEEEKEGGRKGRRGKEKNWTLVTQAFP